MLMKINEGFDAVYRFKITLRTPRLRRAIDLPKDKGLRFFEACERADIYKRCNPQATYSVVEEEHGDILYQV